MFWLYIPHLKLIGANVFSMDFRELYIKPHKHKQNLDTDLFWNQLHMGLFITTKWCSSFTYI